MQWLIGLVAYLFAVWFFLRFFRFVAEVDQEIEVITNKHIHQKEEKAVCGNN